MKETLTKCLDEAGNLLLDYFKKQDLKTEEKSDNSIVTEADLAAEKCIKNIIKEAHPEHGIIGEEEGYEKGNEYTWVIDPVDGTSFFAHGMEEWGVMVALMKDKQPILSGISFPVHNITYLAEKGKGTTKNGKRIHVTEEPLLKNVLFSFGSYNVKSKEELEQEGLLYSRIVRSTLYVGGANGPSHPCAIAEGKIGGMISLYAKIWDVVPPMLIIQEAGGSTTDLEGKPLQLDFDNIQKNLPHLVTTPHLQRQVLDVIQNQS